MPRRGENIYKRKDGSLKGMTLKEKPYTDMSMAEPILTLSNH